MVRRRRAHRGRRRLEDQPGGRVQPARPLGRHRRAGHQDHLARPGSDQLANQTIQNNKVGEIVGTSFATPYVAGLAALIKERYPDLDAYQVMARIEKTAQQAAGKNGWNAQIGHGVVDPIAALTAVIPEEHGITPAPVVAAELDNLVPPPRKDPLPTRVALIGSAAGLALLGLTALVVFTAAASRKP
jgi:membrane-anchored mycosin MYCP